MLRKHRTPPADPALHEAARRQPGGWVYDIDWPYPEDQRTPPEAIRGGWETGQDGRLTGMFAPNPRHRAVRRCTRPLPAWFHAAARSAPDRWIVEIDPRGQDRFPDVPDDMIRGWWHVDVNGKGTDLFRPNSRWIDNDAAGPA